MNKKEFQDFCIKHNLPFTIEFIYPWYPKPIEVKPKDLGNTEYITEIFKQALISEIVYGESYFIILDD